MLIKAEQRNSRQSPRKVRLVMNAVKDLSIPAAVDQLAVMEQKASRVVLRVLQQALANAKNNLGLTVEDLEIHEMMANTGSTYRRWRAVSRGRGHSIQKKTTHVRIVLKTKEVKKTETDKKQMKTDSKQIETDNKKEEIIKAVKNPPSRKATAGKAEKKQMKTDESKKKVSKKK